MPITLLPASAAAFAPRGTPNIVLNSKVDPWLTATLKRINRVKRPLNSVQQHFRCLTETLSSPSAIWTLCTLMLPKAPEAELRKDEDPLIEALFNYQVIYVEAYVVHVDMVSQNEVAFKLTPETIESLVEYHKDVHSVDTAASTWSWSEKDVQLKKLQEDFVQAANKFVYRTNAMALEGLEEDGAGELLCGRSEEVKASIMGLFLPLLPPPPRLVDVVRPAPILPSSTGAENWWQQGLASSHPGPMDSWKVLPSSPSTTSSDSNTTLWTTSTSNSDSNSNMWAGSTTSADSSSSVWATMGFNEPLQLPSPTPSYSQPYTTACSSPPQYYSAPMSMAPIPQLPLPSLLAQQQCSASAGFGGFEWDRYQDFAMPYAM
ncbi:hypothetical protein G7Y79_00004g013890 [Physcia stellaris]|nr:hypothetical protein G7Y79_00004g013890 [Physcia stellaris]